MRDADFIAGQMIGPKRRARDATDRERVAAASLAKTRAKHKGRNHWRNWERRRMAAEAAAAQKIKADRRKAAFDRYCAEARAFWTGARGDHPRKPCHD